MASLSLRHIYKVYPARSSSKKGFFKTIADKIKNKDKKETASDKRAGNFVAVKDFNMEIEDGEFIVFVGPSGCGKSTTLRMIAGLEDISSGELYIDGRIVNDVDPKDRDIAMVFQSYALYPQMTARQIIEFALKLRKIPVEKKDKDGNPVLAIDKKKIKEIKEKLKALEFEMSNADDEEYKAGLASRKEQLEKDLEYFSSTPVQAYSYTHMSKEDIAAKVEWASKVLHIEELLDNKPSEMSGGQRQRIALGRAMVRDPKVFLLDEPLSNLDAKLRTSMRAEIVKLHNELNTTFIYVTHDQVEAMTMGTRIVVMKDGLVQQIDTPTRLYDFPDNKFVAGFIGTPQMNFFDVTIKRVNQKLEVKFANGQTMMFTLAKLRNIDYSYLDGEEHEVSLGIRAEHIKVSAGGNPSAKKLTSTLVPKEVPGTESVVVTGEGLATKLVIKEVLGNSTQLFIKLTEDGPDYVVSLPERSQFKAGDDISISFDEKQVHMFDAKTERSIMSKQFGNN